ncbi:reverse transcriptase domain-containing protein [Tanacetum coccineum]
MPLKTTSTRSTLTLKPLPKIDPKDKGKKKIEEEDETESEDDDIPQVVKKFKQLENDEELARKVQEEWEAEEEKNKIAEEEAANEALIKNFDDVKARIEADRILAEKLQEQEREQFTIEERAKFLHDTIAAQRKFLAQQRSQAKRNKPPTKNQLRNQMITYLKHEDRVFWNLNHNLISKSIEEINLNVVTRSNGQQRHFTVLTSVLSIFDREDLNAVYQLCMRTRSQARRLRQQQLHQQQVPPNLVEPPKDTMADNRTMAELLQAPTEGYEDAIVVPEIEAANFEIKHGLLTLVQNKQFFGHDKEDPHAHIRYFNKITSTLRYPNVPTTSIKLMLFPFSLEGAARIWLEKEPPRSIQTWDDLVAKFINQFFPPSKTTNLRNEITNFKQRFDESFSEAWDRFKDLLRACPHHGFSELHQLDTFYNALNVNDQDSLNSAAGGNFLDKRPANCSSIIESKSKVRHSRSKAIVAKVSTSASTSGVSPDVAELKDMVRALLLDKQTSPVPAPAPGYR